MWQSVSSNWNFFRMLRLLMGLAIVGQAIGNRDFLFGLAGLMFSGMAIFNIGCCGSAGCKVSPHKSAITAKDIVFEEIH